MCQIVCSGGHVINGVPDGPPRARCLALIIVETRYSHVGALLLLHQAQSFFRIELFVAVDDMRAAVQRRRSKAERRVVG